MDGMRKVPPNVPNQEKLREFLGKPLTKVPDPFGTHESFAAHNNARLRAFLDSFGFEYEFMSSTECYKSGRFDATLLKILAAYDRVMDDHAADLGRGAPANLFALPADLPAHRPRAAGADDRARRRRRARSPIATKTATTVEVPVTGGHAKLQWKVDWAMRWMALGVDYEMSGKDLISSVEHVDEDLPRARRRAAGDAATTSSSSTSTVSDLEDQGQRHRRRAVADLLGAREPCALHVSKAEDGEAPLLRHHPEGGRRLRRPSSTSIRRRSEAERLENPVWHIHAGRPPQEAWPVSFALLLNLVSASNAATSEILWGFIRAYAPNANPTDNPSLDRLVGYAMRYYEDFVRPKKKYRAPTEKERAAMEDLASAFDGIGERHRRRGHSKSSCTRSVKSTASNRCAIGSRRSTRCFSAKSKARASVRSRPSTV